MNHDIHSPLLRGDLDGNQWIRRCNVSQDQEHAVSSLSSWEENGQTVWMVRRIAMDFDVGLDR